MARHALRVTTARQVLLGEVLPGRCWWQNRSFPPHQPEIQEEAIVLNFWIPMWRHSGENNSEKCYGHRNPPTFSLWLSHCFRTSSGREQALPTAPVSVLPLDGTRRPGSISTAFSGATSSLIFYLRKGSRQLQRRPGTWRASRQLGNPPDAKLKGHLQGPLPACPCWRHLRTQRLSHLAIRLLRGNKWQTVLLVSLPLFLILKNGPMMWLAREGKIPLGFFFLFFNIESIAHFKTFCHKKCFPSRSLDWLFFG